MSIYAQHLLLFLHFFNISCDISAMAKGSLHHAIVTEYVVCYVDNPFHRFIAGVNYQNSYRLDMKRNCLADRTFNSL